MTARPPRHSPMLLSLLLFANGPATSQPVAPSPEPVPAPVANLTVFVDPPTGFAFVKLATGWKFVGAVDRATVDELPRHVVTSLLVTDTGASPHAGSCATTAGERLANGPASGTPAHRAPARRRHAAAMSAKVPPAASQASADPQPEPEPQPATF